MIGLSRTVGYAIRALACIGRAECRWHPAMVISQCAGVPKPYLSQILHKLAQRGLILSRRGTRGGFALAQPPEKISLLSIVETVEGPHWAAGCLLGFAECGSPIACPTRPFWDRIRREIHDELARLTLADVMQQNVTEAESGGSGTSREASSECGCAAAQPARSGRAFSKAKGSDPARPSLA